MCSRKVGGGETASGGGRDTMRDGDGKGDEGGNRLPLLPLSHPSTHCSSLLSSINGDDWRLLRDVCRGENENRVCVCGGREK